MRHRWASPPSCTSLQALPLSEKYHSAHLLFPIFSLSISSKDPGIKAETLKTEGRRHCPVKALSLLSTLEVNASHDEMSAYLFFLFRTDWQTAYSRDLDLACWMPCRYWGSGRSLAGHSLPPACLWSLPDLSNNSRGWGEQGQN